MSRASARRNGRGRAGRRAGDGHAPAPARAARDTRRGRPA